MTAKPSFLAAWTKAGDVYDPADPIGKVKKIIGGRVKINLEIPADKGGWENTCAVRMSYVLNYTGHPIPRNAQTVSGDDKKWYFYRVRDLIPYLVRVWGKPDFIVPYPALPVSQLQGKKGLILFEIEGWDDAGGHATFWNGETCSDHCYFNAPNVNYSTPKANFWVLP